MKASEWLPIESAPEGVIVKTKIHDDIGERNVCNLFKRNNLFWAADGSMYVYYRPTHWMPLPEAPK